MLDLVGWLGTFAFLAGSIGVAHKHTWGLWMHVVGNSAFLYVGYATGLWSLVATSLVLGGLDIYGVYKWRKL